MPKFVKKPVEVEAVKYNGSSAEIDDIQRWIRTGVYTPSAVMIYDGRSFELATIHGSVTVNAGDWIVKQNQDDFYPVAPSVFEQNYAKVPENWLERVELEQAELQIRTDALNKMLNVTSKPEFISEQQWILLSRQKFHQNQLNNILKERIQAEKAE
ncbi:hypothetical protein NQ845_17315 [Acinetobacter baumannii]|nr:hypothetical protein [Acinetobacter baumannii]